VERFVRPEWRRPLMIAAQVALAAWFAYWTWQTIRFYFEAFPYHLDMIGFDSRIYLHAAQTWLGGGDPWTAGVARHSWGPGAPDAFYYFTGPPPTVLVFAPFAWLSDDAFTVGWMALTVASAIYSLRRLHLPVWWILFPPLALAVFVGNPHVVCLALILSGWRGLQALAPAAKAYAVFPMIGERQWRALGIFAVAGAVSVIVLWPLWVQYVTDYPSIQAWISNATWGGFSASRDPRLFAVLAAAIGALFLIDRRAAGWLSVPALWPAAEFFYASFALPLRSPWLMAALAVPGTQADAFVPWTICAYIVVRLVLHLVRGEGAGAEGERSGVPDSRPGLDSDPRPAA
jgi:hypothetical protein